MTQVKIATSAAALLRGADSLLVIAPRSVLRASPCAGEALPDPLRTWTEKLGSDLEPGALGALAETRVSEGPVAHLVVAALPDTVSRHH